MEKFNQNEIVCFTMPKIGEQEADNQDACCCSNDGSMVAIADGASTSLFAKEWADILVEDFCHRQQESVENLYRNWQQWLKPLQQKWINYSNQIKQNPNIPWYVKGSQEKNSASATFIGLKLHPPNQAGQKIWEAIAIGDSCLFQYKTISNTILPFPISKSSDFTTVTECFNSLPQYNVSQPRYYKDDYDDGDIFILATDALAEWILRDIETKKREGKKLISVATQLEFENFIQNLRHNKLIKNDDTTLCRLIVSADVQQLTTSQHKNIEYSSQNVQQKQQRISEFPIPPTPSVQAANSNTLLQNDHTNDQPGEQSKQQYPIVHEASNQSPIAPPTTSISNIENRENGRLSKNRKLKRIEFFILIGVLGVVFITVLFWFLVRENRKTDETKEQKETVDKFSKTSKDNQINNPPKLQEDVTNKENNLDFNKTDKSNNNLSNARQNNQINNLAKLQEDVTNKENNLDSNKTTQIEFKTPIYSPNSPNSKVIGFLYGKQDNQPKDELDLWVLIPKNYLSDSGKHINIPTDVILPLFQENGQSYFLGYLLTGRYEFFKPRKTPNPFKDSRWVKVKVKLRN
ncbi:MAG: protein phosphatase 2C domain-containing protein [Cyanobacteriota bacterium]|nr:protein phosphatase 2C domain-containing protein [Cyanobacteriota bacterium]